ncbi:hypothetical protein BT96DRAFT_461047 [Gymnopus androsaceus JB14]|uniref:Uncharacterized protein n=1 Tax=Gymnopus androsaceus JB14 TaxID=1447944 RepID=A0A6A4ICN6_9AGAR|nr:hypothetical protein BT96DRAFT_461047 [Gymnopus androsaceus JB14]
MRAHSAIFILSATYIFIYLLWHINPSIHLASIRLAFILSIHPSVLLGILHRYPSIYLISVFSLQSPRFTSHLSIKLYLTFDITSFAPMCFLCFRVPICFATRCSTARNCFQLNVQ